MPTFRNISLQSMVLISGLAAILGFNNAAAQAIPFSQHGSVSQRVGLTDIKIEYNRPVARGRVLFGPDGLVKFGSIWHPGADSASYISFSRAVVLEGKSVPKGEYSIWLMPQASGPWTLILSKAARVFHQPYPGPEQDLLRVPVTPATGSHMEVMAFYFPVVARDSAVLHLHWGTRIVPIQIKAPLDP